jgi:hypothetical protein
MILGEAQRQYQAALEHVRHFWDAPFYDDDDRDGMLADLSKARDELEIAWLEHSLED